MLEIKSINDLVLVLKERKENLISLDQQELKLINSLNKKELPEVYQDFLLNMGKSAGSFMKGSSAFYDEIFDLREWAEELLQENGFKNLPEDSFVFWMHQGYQFCFFILGESDNPNVYYFSETEDNEDFITKCSLLEFYKKQLVG